MGKSEKPGLMESKWTTIILVVVLIVLAVVLIWIFKTGGFDRFKPKKKQLAPLKPSVMNDHYFLSDQAKLQSIDSRLTLAGDLSWRKSV